MLVTPATSVCQFILGLFGIFQDASAPQTPVGVETRAGEALLREMVERRLAGLKTVHVESRWRIHKGDQARNAFYTHKYAGGALLQVFRGDEDGLVYESNAGQPYSYSPLYVLREEDGREWRFQDGAIVAKATSADAELTGSVYDFRVWGLIPLATGPTNYDQRAGHLDPRVVVEATYREGIASVRAESIAPEVRRVTVEFSSGARAVYEINVREDCSPRRIVVLSSEGTEVYSVASTFNRINGRWYPKEMKFRKGGLPWIDIGVLHASFDESSHPARLEPGTELGLLVGTNVSLRKRDGAEPVLWDGTGLSSRGVYSEMLASGQINNAALVERVARYREEPPGRFPPAAARMLLGSASDRARSTRLWEEYTRDFVSLHKLAAGQSASAWAIWGECVTEARKHVDGRSAEIASLETRVARAEASANPASRDGIATGTAASTGARRRLDELWAPVEQIFEKRLVPRLRALLTAEQVADGRLERERLEARMRASVGTADE